MPRTAIQLPFRDRTAKRVGARLWRKQVLPVDRVAYRGGVLDFTRPYLEELAGNFNRGAAGQVPFLLADPQNQHHSDPERYRGDVKGVEVTDDGLYALIETSAEGSNLLTDNPRLGVSARINPATKVLEHVLGTLNPVVTGMRPWEPIELSGGSAGRVLDLSAASYQGDGDLSSMSEQAMAKYLALNAWPT